MLFEFKLNKSAFYLMPNYLFFMHDCDIFVQNISFYSLLTLLDLLDMLILLCVTVLSERKQVLNSIHCFSIILY